MPPALPRLSPAAALLPLRLFLGGTFVYAGIQKLSDPGYLHPGAPTYIGAQLRAFATGTPGGFLLRAFALPAPKLAGVGVALLEIAVGLLALGGLLTRVAAGAGLALNLVLFLTNSWNTSPYFLGSDVVFVFAWLPFVLAGAAGQPALDHVLAGGRSRGRVRPASGAAPPGPPGLTRRGALGRSLAAVGAGTLGIGGLSALVKNRYYASTGILASAPAPPRAPAAASARRAAPGTPPPPAGARSLGPASRVPRGQAALYRDPGDGAADIVVRHADGSLSAHSAACTHAGCNVTYQQGALYCPCHGSVFNARTGAVEQGPAVQPLPVRKVLERGGLIYSVPV